MRSSVALFNGPISSLYQCVNSKKDDGKPLYLSEDFKISTRPPSAGRFISGRASSAAGKKDLAAAERLKTELLGHLEKFSASTDHKVQAACSKIKHLIFISPGCALRNSHEFTEALYVLACHEQNMTLSNRASQWLNKREPAQQNAQLIQSLISDGRIAAMPVWNVKKHIEAKNLVHTPNGKSVDA